MSLLIFSLFRTVLWRDTINMDVLIRVDGGKREVGKCTLKFVVTLDDKVVNRGLEQ
jgi:hypothetical protein